MGLAAALMLFVLLIVVFSVIFFFGEEDEVAAEGETIEVVSEDGTVRTVLPTELQGTVQEQDPLRAELDSLRALLAATSSVRFDSLEQLLAIKDATVRALEDRLQVQDAEIESLREVDVNAQQMARTFATMTVGELTPIVSKLGDKVVLDIYKHTTNKRRKFLLSALGDQRAAELTNRLVKQKGS